MSKRRHLGIAAITALCAVLVIVAVSVAADSTGDSAATPPPSAPAGVGEPAWPEAVVIDGIELSVRVGGEAPGQVCVYAAHSSGGGDALCGPPSDVAREGAIFGRQVGDGPVTVYGLAPRGATVSGSGTDGQGDLESIGGFFVGQVDARVEPVVVFNLPDGRRTKLSLGRPAGTRLAPAP